MTYSEYYELVLLSFKKLRNELNEAEEFTINSYSNAIQAETKPVQQQVEKQPIVPEEKPETKSKGTK